jgi:hypothetical protein
MPEECCGSNVSNLPAKDYYKPSSCNQFERRPELVTQIEFLE